MSARRFLGVLAAAVLALALCCLPAAAEDSGEANVEGSGGGMGSGHAGNYWNAGEYGVRISVIQIKPQILLSQERVIACFDWSNKNESGVQQHFGKTSKYIYINTQWLYVSSAAYRWEVPPEPLPPIIRTSGSSDIEGIKRYFLDRNILNDIAAHASLSYTELISGHYKIVIEPMAYFVFDGLKYAATATEAALLDKQAGGKVYYWLRSLTHQNLPLSMYLEKYDNALSMSCWPSSQKPTGKQSNNDILKYLGVGIITFKDTDAEELPPKSDVDYEFHTDTDVIVSFPIHNSGDEITPDDDAYVDLNVGGTVYHRQIVCPAGETQLVWVRWHTPSQPQELTMTATGAGDSVELAVKVTELKEYTPPDPTYYDKGDGFELADIPDYGSNLSTEWGEWFASWHENMVWHPNMVWHSNWVWRSRDVWIDTSTTDEEGVVHKSGHWEDHGHYVDRGEYVDEGEFVDEGWWDWEYVSYYASMWTEYEVKPDDRCKTDYESHYMRDVTVMPSGYGVQAAIEPHIFLGAGVDSYDVTDVQNVVATFPEFGYDTYFRLLERVRWVWQFKPNEFSLYGSRIHYTPLWYPDDVFYPVAFQVIDCWTPGGQLRAVCSDSVYIWKSCIDDWVIRLVDPDEMD